MSKTHFLDLPPLRLWTNDPRAFRDLETWIDDNRLHGVDGNVSGTPVGELLYKLQSLLDTVNINVPRTFVELPTLDPADEQLGYASRQSTGGALHETLAGIRIRGAHVQVNVQGHNHDAAFDALERELLIAVAHIRARKAEYAAQDGRPA